MILYHLFYIIKLIAEIWSLKREEVRRGKKQTFLEEKTKLNGEII